MIYTGLKRKSIAKYREEFSGSILFAHILFRLARIVLPVAAVGCVAALILHYAPHTTSSLGPVALGMAPFGESVSNFVKKIVKQIGIGNSDLAMESLTSDCVEDQYIRESITNSMQAIMKSNVGDTIVVGNDEYFSKLLGAPKFSTADNGPSMGGREGLEAAVQLFSNESNQSVNKGVGFKIAGLGRSHRKPYGVVIRTWRGGEGWVAYLTYPSAYTIEKITDAAMVPEFIKKAGHGTIITVLGHLDKDDTTAPPSNFDSGQSIRWLVQYVNSRWAVFPRRVNVRVEVRGEHFQKALGFRSILEERCEANGEVILPNTGFTVAWYILPDSGKEKAYLGNFLTYRSSNARGGTYLVLHDNEAYNTTTGSRVLVPFGIYNGAGQVMLVLEPLEPEKYNANVSRSALLKLSGGGKTPINIEAIAAEFRTKIPARLQKFIDEKAGRSAIQSATSFMERLFAVHGHTFVADKKGDHVLPSAKGAVSGAPGMGIGEGEGEPGTGSGGGKKGTPPPTLPVTDGTVPSSDPKDKKARFTKTTGLPLISYQSMPDLSAKHTEFCFIDSKDNVLAYDENCVLVDGTMAALKRVMDTSNYSDAKIRRVVLDHMLRAAHCTYYTSLELLQAKLIDEQEFKQRIDTRSLTVAVSSRLTILDGVKKSLAARKGEDGFLGDDDGDENALAATAGK